MHRGFARKPYGNSDEGFRRRLIPAGRAASSDAATQIRDDIAVSIAETCAECYRSGEKDEAERLWKARRSGGGDTDYERRGDKETGEREDRDD